MFRLSSFVAPWAFHAFSLSDMKIIALSPNFTQKSVAHWADQASSGQTHLW
jgi:hypothetical protein